MTKKSKELPSRELIIQAYLRLAYERGASGITLQDIAKKAKITHGTVRYHFNQVGQDIAQEATLYLVKRAYVYLDEDIYKQSAQADFHPLAAYVNGMFQWVEDYPEEASFLVYYYYLCSTEAALPIPNEIFLQRARARIISLLHESIGRKLFAPVKNPEETALKIHALVAGSCLIGGTARQSGELVKQKALCLEIIRTIVEADRS